MLGKLARRRFALCFELLAQELFSRARFAGQRREGKHERVGDAARADLVHADRLFAGSALEDDGV